MIWKSIAQPWRPTPSYFCPCCKYKTLHARGDFEICKVCFWEDDGQDEHDAEVVRGGSFLLLCLRLALCYFAAFGATEERFCEFVRPPRENEERDLT